MPGFELFGSEERKEVTDVLNTGILMRYGFDEARQGHWKTDELEKAICLKTGTRFAHVCSSGTAAVFTALAACNVGAGDEVIVTPFTFVADIEAVLWLGAIPVFVEIDETLCLDPKSVKAAITDQTKAVLAVHMCGSMARITELAEICRQRNVTLIEDTAQALGASYQGKALGTFGKAGCFSFDFVKTVTCGEGGAVITNDDQVYEWAQAFTDHGHDHRGKDRGLDAHEFLGLNFRISELHAAVGLAQLRKLDQILEIQRKNKQFFKQGLSDIKNLTFRDVPDFEGDSATFLSFFLRSEDAARRAGRELAAAGVDGCFYWYENNWHYHRQWQHFKQLKSPAALAVKQAGWLKHLDALQLPQSDEIMGRTISMLIKLSWSESDLNERLEKMKRVLA